MEGRVDRIRLGDVLVYRKETPDSDCLLKGDIPIVSKITFRDGNIELRETRESRTDMVLIRPGDIVMSCINAAKGAVAIYEGKTPIAATVHYATYSVNEEKANPRYVWWLLRSDSFRRIVERNVPGGIKSELRPSRLLRIVVPIPEKHVQDRIAAALDRLAAESTTTNITWRTGLEQTRILMAQSLDLVMSRYRNLAVLQDVLVAGPRSGPAFETNAMWGGVAVLMPSAVSGFGVDIGKREYGMGDERISEKDRLQEGDILIARGNKPEQVGNAGVVPVDAEGWVAANLLMKMRVDSERIDPRFCVYWLRSPRIRAYIKEKMKGTSPSIQKINQKALLSCPFPVGVPLDEQRSVVSLLDRLDMELSRLCELRAAASDMWGRLVAATIDEALNGSCIG